MWRPSLAGHRGRGLPFHTSVIRPCFDSHQLCFTSCLLHPEDAFIFWFSIVSNIPGQDLTFFQRGGPPVRYVCSANQHRPSIAQVDGGDFYAAVMRAAPPLSSTSLTRPYCLQEVVSVTIYSATKFGAKKFALVFPYEAKQLIARYNGCKCSCLFLKESSEPTT